MTGIFIFILVAGLVLFFFYASYSMEFGFYIKALCKNPAKGKKIALSFDDGPHPQYTPAILDVLKEYDVKACFFCIGNNIKGNEEVLRRIKEEGHLIGNHSFSHSFSFPLYSKKRMIKDLEAFERITEPILSEKTNLFRPPFGVVNPTIAYVTNKMGYQVVGWNLRSFDTCKNKEKVWKKIDRKLSPGSVILLHDPLPESSDLLKGILQIIKEKEYVPIRIDKLFDLYIK